MHFFLVLRIRYIFGPRILGNDMYFVFVLWAGPGLLITK